MTCASNPAVATASPLFSLAVSLSLILLSMMPLAASAERVQGDAERGRLVFAQCRMCHYPEKGVGHNNGPALWNIFGTVVGSQEGFDYYSDVLRQAEFVWTPELLDLWLQDVRAFLPGNMMMSNGVPDPRQRADLIEYLKQFAPESGP